MDDLDKSALNLELMRKKSRILEIELSLHRSDLRIAELEDEKMRLSVNLEALRREKVETVEALKEIEFVMGQNPQKEIHET